MSLFFANQRRSPCSAPLWSGFVFLPDAGVSPSERIAAVQLGRKVEQEIYSGPNSLKKRFARVTQSEYVRPSL